MILIRSIWRAAVVFAAASVVVCAIAPARAQRRVLVDLAVQDAAVQDAAEMEDEDFVEAAPAQAARPVMNDQQFDQWLFNSVGGAQQAAKRFETMLSVQADTVADVCGMAPEQKEKLLLAGRGDIARFFERVEASRKKFQLVKNDQNRINEVFQDIQPLQMAINAGLFNDGSFFHKVVQKSLNEEQRKKLEQTERARREFQYKAKIELVVSALDDSIALRAQQRDELIKMLQATPPPKQFGQYDFYVVLFRLSRLPEATLGRLFDGPQRRALDRQLDQVRGLEPFLKQQGLLPDDEPTAEKPIRAERRAAEKK
jgi:hypothetical protein